MPAVVYPLLLVLVGALALVTAPRVPGIPGAVLSGFGRTMLGAAAVVVAIWLTAEVIK